MYNICRDFRPHQLWVTLAEPVDGWLIHCCHTNIPRIPCRALPGGAVFHDARILLAAGGVTLQAHYLAWDDADRANRCAATCLALRQNSESVGGSVILPRDVNTAHLAVRTASQPGRIFPFIWFANVPHHCLNTSTAGGATVACMVVPSQPSMGFAVLIQSGTPSVFKIQSHAEHSGFSQTGIRSIWHLKLLDSGTCD